MIARVMIAAAICTLAVAAGGATNNTGAGVTTAIAKDAGPGGWESPHAMTDLSAAPAPLIPFPREVHWGGDAWSMPPQVTVAPVANLGRAQRSLAEVLRAVGVAVGPAQQGGGAVRFVVDTNAMPHAEGYELRISSTGVSVVCGDAAGAFYAVQTLRQLIPTNRAAPSLPGCTIRDWPAFGLRGFMHDTGRNFQEVASLKSQLDRLASYKFNTFHWHLTDNPAWRPQSRVYPQLNDPKFRTPGRDPEKSYSFDEIRDVIRYAAEHHIRVIPELDMPGHSEYFERTFGFKMGTEEGMAVLEKLIDEFCAEIPASDCPILHLGSDEVHVPNPHAFMQRMLSRVRANGRTPMVWNPGLVGDEGTIEQLWRDEGDAGPAASHRRAFVDSSFGYLNGSDALGLVQRYFFHQSCRRACGDDHGLGGILCCWPDVRVDDKRKILLHSPVWPGALAFAEAVWCGREVHHAEYLSAVPAAGSQAWNFFREFEGRLAAHRDRFFAGEPFPYVQFAQVPWRIAGPFLRGSNDTPDHAFVPEREIRDRYAGIERAPAWRVVHGGWLNFRSLVGGVAKLERCTMYALTYVYSESPAQMRAWVGFETAARSNRRSGGIPSAGKWCSNGGAVFVNDVPLAAPAWKHPGTQRYLHATWGTPANEIPYDDEEFYWAREPATVPLKAGWNKILLRVPCAYADQNWSAAFIPVRQGADGRWIEDMSVRMSAQP